jgi:hypothetical protein
MRHVVFNDSRWEGGHDLRLGVSRLSVETGGKTKITAGER